MKHECPLAMRQHAPCVQSAEAKRARRLISYRRSAFSARRSALGYLLIGAVVLAGLLPPRVLAQTAGQQRAGVVVQFSDGSVQTACVAFSEAEISGLDLLRRAGLTTVVQQSPIGAAVCKIERDGCDYPAETCFCASEGSRALYWAYYQRADGAWRYSNLSAAGTKVHDGDIDGWAWGAGSSGSGAQPPVLDFATVCAAPAVASATPLPSAPSQPATPTAAPPTPAAQQGGGTLAFAAFVLIMIVGIVLTKRRA